MALRITEIFYSLQGESTLVGLPTVFIRLTGCPLRCNYCDTSYAFQGGEKMQIAEIIKQAEQYNAKHITVTGGEPMAQTECIDLMQQLLDKGFIVSLETSGALGLANVDKRVIKVIDLKTPSSTEQHRNRYDNIAYLNHQDQVKFVIADEQDYQWAKKIIEQYRLTNRCEVLFSPCMDKQAPSQLADKILADQLPVRFQLQLHKILWGDRPGK